MYYYVTASNRNGHGTHSPFVFDFIINVLIDKKKYACYTEIEAGRKRLLKEKTVINVEDFGAGSAIIKTNDRVIKDIARSSLKPKKYAQLLYRMVQHYAPNNVLELGTSLGITTAYLAAGNKAAAIFTCEGDVNIAATALRNFKELGASRVRLKQGNFDDTLSPLLKVINKVNFVFIDGNHRKIPTLQYFEKLLTHAENATILVFDDIHWSEEMEAAWLIIQQHPAVTLTIDLFFIGIVCISKDVKVKQHFTIAY